MPIYNKKMKNSLSYLDNIINNRVSLNMRLDRIREDSNLYGISEANRRKRDLGSRSMSPQVGYGGENRQGFNKSVL